MDQHVANSSVSTEIAIVFGCNDMEKFNSRRSRSQGLTWIRATIILKAIIALPFPRLSVGLLLWSSFYSIQKKNNYMQCIALNLSQNMMNNSFWQC